MAVNAAKHYLPTCDFEATKPCSWRESLPTCAWRHRGVESDPSSENRCEV